jgi:hypothetical protein
MPQSNWDTTARRFSSPSFDTELPPDARAELRRSRDPRHPDVRVIGWVLVLAAALIGGVLWQQQGGERAPNKAISPTLVAPQRTPQPTPAPSRPQIIQPRPSATTAPGWHADGTAYKRADIIEQRPAPRAELEKLPPPKAQLVRLPWKIGSLHPLQMPYGIAVSARYKGVLSSEAKLPKSGNHIGGCG